MTFNDNKNISAVPQAPHSLLFPLAKGIDHHNGVGTNNTLDIAQSSHAKGGFVPFGYH